MALALVLAITLESNRSHWVDTRATKIVNHRKAVAACGVYAREAAKLNISTTEWRSSQRLVTYRLRIHTSAVKEELRIYGESSRQYYLYLRCAAASHVTAKILRKMNDVKLQVYANCWNLNKI